MRSKPPVHYGKDNNRYNGGLSTCDGRTIIVHRDGKHWTFWYRAIMEVHLGRELRSDEIVHHINGDPGDDRLENLQLMSRAEHLEVHRAAHDRAAIMRKAWITRRAKEPA